MKNSDRNELIERLQGFDDKELQQEMTDGLEQWCLRRKERGRRVRRGALLALLLLTTTAIALTALPKWIHLPAADDGDVAATPEAGLKGSRPSPTPESVAEPPAPVAHPEPVDYYYTGVAEDGYSVAYGHDSRTLTYTRYSGSHLIHSVIRDTDDPFGGVDSAVADDESPLPGNDSMAVLATKNMVPCHFQTVDYKGDAFYITVIDSLRHLVSVRGDVAQWMGQRILYSDTLVVPDVVQLDSVNYTVVALADSAFAGHRELRAVVLPTTVVTVGDMAFADCSGLASLTVPVRVPPEAFSASFEHTDAGLTLVVPCGSASAYQNDAEWVYFQHITEDCRRFSDPRSPRIRVIRKP